MDRTRDCGKFIRIQAPVGVLVGHAVVRRLRGERRICAYQECDSDRYQMSSFHNSAPWVWPGCRPVWLVKQFTARCSGHRATLRCTCASIAIRNGNRISMATALAVRASLAAITFAVMTHRGRSDAAPAVFVRTPFAGSTVHGDILPRDGRRKDGRGPKAMGTFLLPLLLCGPHHATAVSRRGRSANSPRFPDRAPDVSYDGSNALDWRKRRSFVRLSGLVGAMRACRSRSRIFALRISRASSPSPSQQVWRADDALRRTRARDRRAVSSSAFEP